MKQGRLIVISAPSGCGKSTIINRILDSGVYDLQFSVSATNRQPREGEVDGVHYRFLTTGDFNAAIDRGDFIEWEEVYPGRYYGTLHSEVDRMLDAGHNVVLDIDVKGAANVKKAYGDRCMTLFIEPPSIDVLRQRLESRGTESPETIDTRVARARYELEQAGDFDVKVVNDELDKAVEDTRRAFDAFLKQPC